MGKKTNVGYRLGDINAHLQKERLTAINRRFHVLERMTEKYKNLESVHQLQSSTARNCMHNVMSPLSAVSGYFELLIANLNNESDSEKIERYSQKVSDGLNEIGFLLEQLHEMFRTDQEDEENEEVPVVELNWLVEEVSKVINNSTDLRAEKIVYKSLKKPVFVQAELFQLKLMIYNLVISADKFSTGKCTLEIEVDAKDGLAVLIVSIHGDTVMDEKFMDLFQHQETIQITDDMSESSQNLYALKNCSRIAEQINGYITLNVKNNVFPQFEFNVPQAQSDERDLRLINSDVIKKAG